MLTITIIFIYPTVYITAPHRYIIIEDFGCSSTLHVSSTQLILRSCSTLTLSHQARQPEISLAIKSLHKPHSLLLKSYASSYCVWSWVFGHFWSLSIFFPMPPGKIPSYPGWAAVHKDFHDIPMIPWSFLPQVLLRVFERSFWYRIISGFLTFGVFVCTEDVRGDISRFWSLLTHNIPCLYRSKAELLSSPCREASSHGSSKHYLV